MDKEYPDVKELLKNPVLVKINKDIDDALDNNLKDFSLPISVQSNEEYRTKVQQKLFEYKEDIRRPAFACKSETLEFIETECGVLLRALDNLIEGNEKLADEAIAHIFSLYKDNPFFVSELDKSYSFREIAPFDKFKSKGYEELYEKIMREELIFYRVRTKGRNDEGDIKEVKHMLHLPFSMRDKAYSGRFSLEGSPCLYLGKTTYVCSKETGWNEKDEMYASVFIPNDKGKSLKVMNLTISQELINGFYNRPREGENEERRELWENMLKIFPLVIATSFFDESNQKVKYEYLLSQALMRVANERGIDGIAYFSMRGNFQFPYEVNLALPAVGISEKKEYSDICKGFKISKPIMDCVQKHGKSYINKVNIKKCEYAYEKLGEFKVVDIDKELKPYSDTFYAKFDDYLVAAFVTEDV